MKTLLGVASLTALAGVPAVLLLAPQAGEVRTAERRPLSARVEVLRGARGNVVWFHGETGAVLIEPSPAPLEPEAARALREQERVPLRYRILLGPPDPNAGDVDRAAGDAVQTVAHKLVHEAMQRKARGADLAFEGTLYLHLDGEKVSVQHKGVARTEADTFAYLHQEQVLVVGDLVQSGVHPAAPQGGGAVRQWLRVLKELRKDFKGNEALKVVPSVGAPGGLELLQEQIDYLQDLIDVVDEGHRRGLDLQETLDSAGAFRTKHRRTGDPRALIESAYRL